MGLGVSDINKVWKSTERWIKAIGFVDNKKAFVCMCDCFSLYIQSDEDRIIHAS